jgi:K+-transporting ATPase KdpF subunit
MDAMQLIAIVLACGLMLYLVFAMLCPERFS